MQTVQLLSFGLVQLMETVDGTWSVTVMQRSERVISAHLCQPKKEIVCVCVVGWGGGGGGRERERERESYGKLDLRGTGTRSFMWSGSKRKTGGRVMKCWWLLDQSGGWQRPGGYSHSAECGGPHISLHWPWPRPLHTHPHTHAQADTHTVTVSSVTVGQIRVLGEAVAVALRLCGTLTYGVFHK